MQIQNAPDDQRRYLKLRWTNFVNELHLINFHEMTKKKVIEVNVKILSDGEAKTISLIEKPLPPAEPRLGEADLLPKSKKKIR